ncbi:helix-turn-helix transcriptional regulator [Fulvivirga sp. M361]|uniref:helix-turn-helix domain-containing protein n=1 Tax=Fulvivirga sp. M361 TaxID=2594266 RepID=UPI00117AFF06|nr:helix-turn-helix transcriptional regulator [Fulvivirga sp. M361]TRX60072.1 helix-turn-helix transcriptional regulator [Fulvivirga sp. M361]
MESTTTPRSKHLGRNVRRMREILGVKQETVAEKLGVTQQTVSNIESNEEVENDTLEQIADALGVKPEAIKGFNEEQTIYNIQHNHEPKLEGTSQLVNVNYQCTFNPIEKWVEALEKNEKLYEALLKSEREKVVMMEKFLKGQK